MTGITSQGWQGSTPASVKRQVSRGSYVRLTACDGCPFAFDTTLSGQGLGASSKEANAMTITQKMLSDLSCMFTVTSAAYRARYNEESQSNYDYLEANGRLGHSLPSLELASSRFEELPNSYKEAVKEQAYQALRKVMNPSAADIALACKPASEALTADTIEARDIANRPDSIPSDLNVTRVTGWEPEKRVFIPAKAAKDASLTELVAANTKPDGFMVNLPMRPVGTVLGTISAEAWRKGEASSIAVHSPKPLPPYQHPQRELTAGEQEAAAWLAQDRVAKPATRSSRMSRMAARFWDKGDGHTGLQPVMVENASLRALGRIAKAQRALAAAQ